ncbi:MAG: prepilin-type N-terminal cleavage/methylation domain-containing protein [Verrucomicrobia bacterium]|nr:MAG: prepilin-type N-terminal cleavage/methylation domain-containing protein [Verrucomicrobiota bacterium]
MSAADQRGRAGFTLLEVLVALTILVTVMAIVGAAMVTTINGWDRGQRALEGLRRGEHVMDQLANALRSTAGGGASTKQGIYSFQISNSDDNPPAGTMSWVTGSAAFLPPGSPLAYGLHRISLGIEQTDAGRPALVVRAWPYLVTDADQIDAAEPGFIAPEVSGLACRVFDYQVQDWQTAWTSSNALPALVEITLYVNNDASNAPTAEPLVLQRLIEMPLGVTNVTDAMRITLNPFPPAAGGGKKANQNQKGQQGQNGPRGPGQGNQWGGHSGGDQGGTGPGQGQRRSRGGGLLPPGRGGGP